MGENLILGFTCFQVSERTNALYVSELISWCSVSSDIQNLGLQSVGVNESSQVTCSSLLPVLTGRNSILCGK